MLKCTQILGGSLTQYPTPRLYQEDDTEDGRLSSSQTPLIRAAEIALAVEAGLPLGHVSPEIPLADEIMKNRISLLFLRAKDELGIPGEIGKQTLDPLVCATSWAGALNTRH